MSESMPIDFSPLDPRSDPDEWDRLVARVLRDARRGEGDAPGAGPGDDPHPSHRENEP